jgi:large subunit ribosomal protein L21
MYAVIEHGAKQYKVTEGDVVKLDLMDSPPDSSAVELQQVLLIRDEQNVHMGRPYIDGAKVIARFDGSAAEAVVKGPKLYPTHFRRRKNSKKRIGHRQKYLQVVIDKIQMPQS